MHRRGRRTGGSPLRVRLVSPLPGAAGPGTFLPSSLHFPFLFFFPLVFTGEGGKGGAKSPPRGTAQDAPTRPPPRRAHKSGGAGLEPRGRGAGQSVPARGGLTWRGHGSPGTRAEPHRPRSDPAGARLCLDGAGRGREAGTSP